MKAAQLLLVGGLLAALALVAGCGAKGALPGEPAPFTGPMRAQEAVIVRVTPAGLEPRLSTARPGPVTIEWANETGLLLDLSAKGNGDSGRIKGMNAGTRDRMVLILGEGPVALKATGSDFVAEGTLLIQ
jgi:hypothetical protein